MIKNTLKFRTLLIAGVFVAMFLALAVRVYWVQAVEGPVLLEKAKKMWEENKVLSPVRGTIYDRNNKVLVQDAPAYTVVVNPRLINEKGIIDEMVVGVSPLLGMDTPEGRDKLRDIMTKKNSEGKYLVHREVRNEGWKIDLDVAKELREMIELKGWAGIHLIEEPKRYYPANRLASHILGYQDKEGVAVMGLEAYYNDILSGEAGMINYESDLLGYETPDSQVSIQPAIDGKSLRLTIDENIQLFMEQAIQNSSEKYKPKSIMAVAADPQTMEILGVANYPNYNPNRYWDYNDFADFYNHAVSSQYEPGSTFKIVTLAASVEEGLFAPHADYMSGSINVPGTTIKDHNYGMGWGRISYLEGLKRSSNVAFVKMGYEQLGKDRLLQYISDFGFGEKSGIDLPGEVSGIVNLRRPAEVATATFGQGLTVTAIQQLAATSVIANGGKLMRPYIVKEVIDSETDQVLVQNNPQVVRQVISAETAKKVGEYLETTVSDQELGTGRLVYIDGYEIAAKTGTAQKVINGKYSDNKWVISLAGFAPLDNPRIALIVIIDEPDMKGDYRNAGPIVSEVFREIMSKSLRYLGIASTDGSMAEVYTAPSEVTVLDVTGLSLLAAENDLHRLGLDTVVLGEGTRIVKQYPEAGAVIHPLQKVFLLSEEPSKSGFPSMIGQSLRDVMQVCSFLERKCEVEGSGYVVSQRGDMVNKEPVIHLKLLPLNEELEDEVQEEENPDLDPDAEYEEETDSKNEGKEQPTNAAQGARE